MSIEKMLTQGWRAGVPPMEVGYSIAWIVPETPKAMIMAAHILETAALAALRWDKEKDGRCFYSFFSSRCDEELGVYSPLKTKKQKQIAREYG